MGRVFCKPSTSSAAARHAERRPALPLGFPGIDGEHFHEGGKGFVQPQAVPPRHRDQVAEPHVSIFMGHHVGHALQLGMSRGLLIHQKSGLPEGDGSQVLHGAGGEVGNGQQIELVAWIRTVVVFLIKVQRERTNVAAKGGQLALAGNAPNAQGCTAGTDRLGCFQSADHEGQQVSGHRDGVGKAHYLLAALNGFGADRGIGDGLECRINDERGREHCLERRLIPAGQSTAGVGGLELRGGEVTEVARCILVLAAIETPEFVVECALEGQMKLPCAWGNASGEDNPAAFGLFVQGDAAGCHAHVCVGMSGATCTTCPRRRGHGTRHSCNRSATHFQFSGVEHDLCDWLLHSESDEHFACEGAGGEVGFKAEIVAGWNNGSRQPIRIHRYSSKLASRAA